MRSRKLLHVIFIVLVILAKRQCEKRLKKWTIESICAFNPLFVLKI